MSSDERDTVHLKEVLDLLDLTIENVPKDKDQFLKDINVRDATALRIQAVGEHMRSLSEAFRDAHPELPWRQSIAMRNIIAHEYGNIDYEIVWEVVVDGHFDSFRDLVTKILDTQV